MTNTEILELAYASGLVRRAYNRDWMDEGEVDEDLYTFARLVLEYESKVLARERQ